jgi:hypothetical protein
MFAILYVLRDPFTHDAFGVPVMTDPFVRECLSVPARLLVARYHVEPYRIYLQFFIRITLQYVLTDPTGPLYTHRF